MTRIEACKPAGFHHNPPRATRRGVLWTNHPFVDAEKPLWEGHRLLKEVDWVLNESPEAAWLDWLRARVGSETLIAQNLCGWEGHDANLWRKIDPQVFGLYGFAKADAQTTLPTAKVPANLKNIKLRREAYHKGLYSIHFCPYLLITHFMAACSPESIIRSV